MPVLVAADLASVGADVVVRPRTPAPVKGLFRWVARADRIVFNRASELEPPRTERRLPWFILNLGEVAAAWAPPNFNNPRWLVVRARAGEGALSSEDHAGA